MAPPLPLPNGGSQEEDPPDSSQQPVANPQHLGM